MVIEFVEHPGKGRDFPGLRGLDMAGSAGGEPVGRGIGIGLVPTDAAAQHQGQRVGDIQAQGRVTTVLLHPRIHRAAPAGVTEKEALVGLGDELVRIQHILALRQYRDRKEVILVRAAGLHRLPALLLR